MATLFLMLGASSFLVIGLMIILWVIYIFQKNSGVVDIGWALGFLLAAWSYFLFGTGDVLKMVVITLMATLWAGRLAWHLFSRFDLDVEDPRYQELRKSWGGDQSNVLFLMMFVFQGFLVLIISLPFLLVDLGSHEEWSWWEFSGILIWLIGVAGEAWADWELNMFLSDPDTKGKVCKKGLWRFSRHPNYFFEAIIWIGFCLFALPSSGGWIAVVSPVLMIFLLLRVSGIPPTEAHSLQTKGEAYREYQRTTNAFIPWFPKK